MTTEAKTNTYVLYHASCTDGFGAAFAAWLKLHDDAQYIPVQYGESIPEIPDDSTVYILDFSYDRQTLLEFHIRAKSLVVLDHHKTAREALSGLGFARFDESKSGAVLAWEWFHPDKPVPVLFQYIQDRDLWRWELPNSREVSAYLRLQSFDFSAWEYLLCSSGEDSIPYWWIKDGNLILSAQAQHVLSLCNKAITVTIAGHQVPAVNSPLFQSEIGDELCRLYPESPFAAAWFCLDLDREVWSLRSRNGFDVSEVAKAMGGGGHAAAAGFTAQRGAIAGV